MHLIDSIEEKKLYHNRRRLPNAQYDTSAGTHTANSARMLLAADRDFLYLIFQMAQQIAQLDTYFTGVQVQPKAVMASLILVFLGLRRVPDSMTRRAIAESWYWSASA